MSESPALLAANAVSVGRRAPLLGDVTWELRAGESWFLLGANGAGKSTLLLTMLGLLPPLRGAVTWHQDLRSRAALGFVPQQDASHVALPITVREFVALGLCDLMLPRHDLRARVDDALRTLAITGLGARQLAELSLGQRRRALVARALARRPRLLVLDEPTANLDPDTAEQLAHDLDRLRRDDGVCVLHACHDRHLAARFATHVARIRDGQLELRTHLGAGPSAEVG